MPPKEYNQKITIGKTAVSAAVADDASEQINGLSGVGKLCADCGMLFVFKEPKMQHFWMYGMKFPLDFIFIREGTVTEVAENVPVSDAYGVITQIRSEEPADMVLEVNAGFISKNKVTIGSKANYR